MTGGDRGIAAPMAWLAAASCLFAAALAVGGARADETWAVTPESRVHRLTESQYRASIADVFGADIPIVGRFPPDLRIDGLHAVGAGSVSVNAAALDQYQEIARGIAGQVTDETHRGEIIGCAPADAESARFDCARRFFAAAGLKLYRRPLTTPEVEAYARAAVAAAEPLGDFYKGVSVALAAMLSSPDFLFRIDRANASGTALDGYSRASRLSFLLWNTGPDTALLKAAGEGELDTADGLARMVDQMLASPRFVEGQRAYFTDYLRLDDIDNLSKDTLIYPAFTASVAEAAREQTLRTVIDLLVERDGDFRDLFTTRRVAMTTALGPIYDIPVRRSGWYFHEFPANDPRAGLLTHSSLLALHSHPGRTSPTLRGLALNEIFLCEKVPAPPANVNFAVVQDVDNPTLRTTRERLKAHLDDEECASCHRRTDPMGLGLEQFDGAGQFRTREHDVAIDVSGAFEDRAFDGAAALGRLFHDSERVKSCFVKTAWRYAHGRNPGASDAAAIARLASGFSEQGYRVAPLMRSIALDPAFFALPRDQKKGRLALAASPKGVGQ